MSVGTTVSPAAGLLAILVTPALTAGYVFPALPNHQRSTPTDVLVCLLRLGREACPGGTALEN
jgi:hypothetical protein